jgi:hypothetical protein
LELRVQGSGFRVWVDSMIHLAWARERSALSTSTAALAERRRRRQERGARGREEWMRALEEDLAPKEGGNEMRRE